MMAQQILSDGWTIILLLEKLRNLEDEVTMLKTKLSQVKAPQSKPNTYVASGSVHPAASASSDPVTFVHVEGAVEDGQLSADRTMVTLNISTQKAASAVDPATALVASAEPVDTACATSASQGPASSSSSVEPWIAESSTRRTHGVANVNRGASPAFASVGHEGKCKTEFIDLPKEPTKEAPEEAPQRPDSDPPSENWSTWHDFVSKPKRVISQSQRSYHHLLPFHIRFVAFSLTMTQS